MKIFFDINRSVDSPWKWFPLAIILTISPIWYFSRDFYLYLPLYSFFPLFSVWLAIRYGEKSFVLLISLSLFAVFEASWNILATLTINFGIPEWIYIISLCSAVVISSSNISQSFLIKFNPRWKWLKWIALFSLWIITFDYFAPSWEFHGLALRSIKVNFGYIFFLITLLFSINISDIKKLSSNTFIYIFRKFNINFAYLILIVFIFAFIFNLKFDDSFNLYIYPRLGFSYEYSTLLILGFILTVTKIVEWRLMIIFILAFILIEIPLSGLLKSAENYISSIPMLLNDAGNRDFTFNSTNKYKITNLELLINLLSIIFLAIAIQPFLGKRNLAPLKTKQTSFFIFLILITIFIGLPASSFYIDNVSLMILGILSFISGYVWCTKGLIGAPLIILASYILSYTLFKSNADLNSSSSIYQLISIGIIVFPYAFFGLLAHRNTSISKNN